MFIYLAYICAFSIDETNVISPHKYRIQFSTFEHRFHVSANVCSALFYVEKFYHSVNILNVHHYAYFYAGANSRMYMVLCRIHRKWSFLQIFEISFTI